jgi:alpha-aminoadipate carrier protein LysW
VQQKHERSTIKHELQEAGQEDGHRVWIVALPHHRVSNPPSRPELGRRFLFYEPQRHRERGENIMTTPTCPECGAEIAIPTNAMAHELLPCPDCGTELEIVSLNPVALERAPEVEEDWGE